MVKTRVGVNIFGKETKGKKKKEETSDDACIVVKPQEMEDKGQNVKGQKKSKVKRGKGEGSTTTPTTRKRCLPPLDTTQEMAPQQPTLYLPWVDVTNVREIENPRPEAEGRDADVGGDEPTVIPTEGESIGEAIPPIVEGRFGDSSHDETVEVVGLLEHSVASSAADSVGKVGPYLPKVVSEFIYNMTDDVEDPESENYQKVTFRKCTVDFSPSTINAYYARANGGETG
ncbi:hypothetical protein LIER_34959 [Lithospermum erythrorhizon]|uniref:Uncharacterized protein n=1 Tax=Lithospermum erythrorhizon TaxID=34254 RepID=A0AAV3NHQ7_LITER